MANFSIITGTVTLDARALRAYETLHASQWSGTDNISQTYAADGTSTLEFTDDRDYGRFGETLLRDLTFSQLIGAVTGTIVIFNSFSGEHQVATFDGHTLWYGTAECRRQDVELRRSLPLAATLSRVFDPMEIQHRFIRYPGPSRRWRSPADVCTCASNPGGTCTAAALADGPTCAAPEATTIELAEGTKQLPAAFAGLHRDAFPSSVFWDLGGASDLASYRNHPEAHVRAAAAGRGSTTAWAANDPDCVVRWAMWLSATPTCQIEAEPAVAEISVTPIFAAIERTDISEDGLYAAFILAAIHGNDRATQHIVGLPHLSAKTRDHVISVNDHELTPHLLANPAVTVEHAGHLDAAVWVKADPVGLTAGLSSDVKATVLALAEDWAGSADELRNAAQLATEAPSG